MKDLLATIADFLEDEADNRAAAGSEMSDYEREPRELAERVRQAISAPPAPVAGGWRDISTAPKNGTPILAFNAVFGVYNTCFTNRWTKEHPDHPSNRGYKGFPCGFVASGLRGYPFGRWDCQPTHWMPLPAPPSTDPVPVGGDEHPTPDAAGELAEALADLEREAHATRYTAGGNVWMHGKATGLLEAVGRIEAAARLRSQGEAR